MTQPKRFLDDIYDVRNHATADKTEAMYDDWAKTYDNELVGDNAYAMPARVGEATARHIFDRDTKMLDVGCGTGLAGVDLARRGFSTIDGCDISNGMLELAGELKVYRQLFKADLTRPPIPVADQFYGGVVCVSAIGFGHIGPDAIDECLRVLRPGGVFILTANDVYHESGELQAKLDDIQLSGWARIIEKEHGDHIPGQNIGGWLYVLRK